MCVVVGVLVWRGCLFVCNVWLIVCVVCLCMCMCVCVFGSVFVFVFVCLFV